VLPRLAASRRRGEVDGDLRHVGSTKVVDRDGVGATQGVELDVLDAVEVHDDVADVPGKPHPPTVGRDIDILVDVCAVEHERIGPGLTFDCVAAVAWIPDERVVAVAEQGHVVAAPAGYGVVAVAAEEQVGALASNDGVVAGTTVDREFDPIGTEQRRVDCVVAAKAIDD
jgi:hypothetical protein